MTEAADEFNRFQMLRTELDAQLRAVESPFDSIGMKEWQRTIRQLRDRLTSERFRVIILGEFKRGKSTFINALIGKEILPAFATPCTAIITEIKWGDEPKALLHFKNPLPEIFSSSLPIDTLQHLQIHRGREVPPLQVPVDRLEAFVAIPEAAKDEGASIAETPYDRIELFWPLELLRQSVELIDSPGLNEHGSRTKITMDYLTRIDAVVFVFAVGALAAQSELNVIDRDVRGAGHECVFFVCNRFDELRRREDREKIRQYAEDKLAPRTSMGKEGIFYISALDALIGRVENDPVLVEKSRVPPLETRLAEFLVNDRGRIKLLQPAGRLRQGIAAALTEVVPGQRKLLDADVDELKRLCNDAQPKLDEAEELRKTLLERLEKARRRVRDAAHDAAVTHLRSIADRVPGWITQLELKGNINALKVLTIDAQVKALVSEIIAGLEAKMEEADHAWRTTRLQAILVDAIEDFRNSAGDAIQQIFAAVGKIRSELSGRDDEAQAAEVADRSSSGRGLVGASSSGSSQAISAGTNAVGNEIAKLVAAKLAVTVGAIAFAHMNPITVIPAVLGLGALAAFGRGDILRDKVKGETAKALSSALVAEIPTKAEQIADSAHDALGEDVAEASERMEEAIQMIRDQVEIVLQKREAGEEEVARQRQRLQEAEQALAAVQSNVEEFIGRLQGR